MGARTYQPGELIRGTVYRVVRHIATGGMGSVFDVEDTTVGKRYVLKTLHPDLFGRNDLARRMEQEARVLARLQHPNIVEVVTAGETQDELRLPYYVMERLNGQNLRTVLEKKGALDRVHAYRIGIDLLDALAHAHDNGVIHRDVKPENVFLHRNLNGTTTTKLLDFGIMRLLDSATKTDTMGRFVGTMRYASPEQVLTHTLTPSTDVYSAGLVVYEMLAGQGPFDDIRDLVEVGRAHIQSPPPPLSRFVSLPPEAETLVMRSLAKEPLQRPKDSFTFASELRRILRDAESAPQSQHTMVNPLTASPSQVVHPGFAAASTRHEGPPGAGGDGSTGFGPTSMPDTPIYDPRQHGAAGPGSALTQGGRTLQSAGLGPPPEMAPTMVAAGSDAATQAQARAAFAPTLASLGHAATAASAAVVSSEGPTVARVAPVVPFGPTLASNAGPVASAYPLGAGAPSAPPPSPGTAVMLAPAPQQQPPQRQSHPSHPAFNPSDPARGPMTAPPATPIMQPAQRAAIGRTAHLITSGSPPGPPAGAPPGQAVPQPSAPPAGVDRYAETRGYQPGPAARAPSTDTHRVDDHGRTVAGSLELVFPRGHGAVAQTSTGGAAAVSLPASRREARSRLPAMLTGMVLAFVALVPTGLVMKRIVPPRAAASRLAPVTPAASVASAEVRDGRAAAGAPGVGAQTAAALSAAPSPTPLASSAPGSADVSPGVGAGALAPASTTTATASAALVPTPNASPQASVAPRSKGVARPRDKAAEAAPGIPSKPAPAKPAEPGVDL